MHPVQPVDGVRVEGVRAPRDVLVGEMQPEQRSDSSPAEPGAGGGLGRERRVEGLAEAVQGVEHLLVLQEVEGHLGEADDICAFLLKNHPSIASDKDGEFTSNVENLEGLFKVRLGAFLTKKGEATFERKTYESIEAIIQTLLKEVYELLMKQETLIQLPVSAKWQAILAKVKEPEQKEEAEPQGSKLLSVDELTSKEEAAFRAGFKPGKLIYEKSVGPTEGQ